MTKTININEVQNSLKTLIALTKNGDEIILEENGKLLAKIVSFANFDLNREFAEWEAASDEDFINFETKLTELK